MHTPTLTVLPKDVNVAKEVSYLLSFLLFLLPPPFPPFPPLLPFRYCFFMYAYDIRGRILRTQWGDTWLRRYLGPLKEGISPPYVTSLLFPYSDVTQGASQAFVLLQIPLKKAFLC